MDWITLLSFCITEWNLLIVPLLKSLIAETAANIFNFLCLDHLISTMYSISDILLLVGFPPSHSQQQQLGAFLVLMFPAVLLTKQKISTLLHPEAWIQHLHFSKRLCSEWIYRNLNKDKETGHEPTEKKRSVILFRFRMVILTKDGLACGELGRKGLDSPTPPQFRMEPIQ